VDGEGDGARQEARGADARGALGLGLERRIVETPAELASIRGVMGAAGERRWARRAARARGGRAMRWPRSRAPLASCSCARARADGAPSAIVDEACLPRGARTALRAFARTAARRGSGSRP